MKTKMVKRFYCDFCGKGSMRSDCMVRHEVICFYNPNRACLTCGEEDASGFREPTLVADNIAKLKAHLLDPQKLLHEITCPTCVLAAVIQYQDKHHSTDPEDHISFDHKTEFSNYHRRKNESDATFVDLMP